MEDERSIVVRAGPDSVIKYRMDEFIEILFFAKQFFRFFRQIAIGIITEGKRIYTFPHMRICLGCKSAEVVFL